eukprot:gnl/TRDRNA2_/TRDRNA2_50309_c0_seq1.p1 gnl/TRDRNA2_/TRDRNA2_50309_c0~~gnl/TRDRNA2_/TRDRNA2_50309_c0_seq1.p1  ORF type:complete len:320 (+),score=46.40 gnl/TRDRNA2_/TRDRNA2_50309_c0_seq1:118-1077(+)
MTNPNRLLCEPLIQETNSRSRRCGGTFLALLSFAIGCGLLPWADIGKRQSSATAADDISEGQSPAITMASMMPRHQMTFGKNAISWQSRSVPRLQPRISRQISKGVRVSAEPYNPPPTFGMTKMKFQEALLPKLLHPLYQKFFEDYLEELHFYVYTSSYKYDGLFALGLREFFATASGTYDQFSSSGESENVFSACCTAVGLDGQQIIKDADTMRTYAKSASPTDIRKHMEGTEKPSDSFVAATFEEYKRSSRFRSIGLFKVLEFSGVKLDDSNTEMWAKAANMRAAKLKSDIGAYAVNLSKMKDGDKMVKDVMDLDKI